MRRSALPHCPELKLLYASIAGVGNVDAIVGIDPQSVRPSELTDSSSELAERRRTLPDLTVNRDHRSADGAYVNVALLVDSQSIARAIRRPVGMRKIEPFHEVGSRVDDLNARAPAIEDEDVAMVEGDIRGVVKRTYASAAAILAEPAENFAREIEHEDQITGTVHQVQASGFAVDGDTVRADVVVLTLIVSDIAHEAAVAIEHNQHASIRIGHIDVIVSVHGDAGRLV
jgi:hypothetical protein